MLLNPPAGGQTHAEQVGACMLDLVKAPTPSSLRFCGLFVLTTTLWMLLAADADQRKIKSASIRRFFFFFFLGGGGGR